MTARIFVTALSLAIALGAGPAHSLPRQAPAVMAEHGFAIAPVGGRVERAFDPPATRYSAGHRGVDLAARPGEPIAAAMSGTVTFAGEVAGVGWVTVAHGGELDTTYGPVEPRLVDAGTVVVRGEILGFVAAGATHLDWGARFGGDYLDPLTLLGQWETYLTTEDADDLPVLGGQTLSAEATVSAGALRWPAAGALTSGYGTRVHPVTGETRLHAGIDIGAGTGTAVTAAASGVVAFAGVAGGYGNLVIVEHGEATQTYYAHLSRIAVRAGQTVRAGQGIGAVGSTGLSTGPHLHFEVRVSGTPGDPLAWLSRR